MPNPSSPAHPTPVAPPTWPRHVARSAGVVLGALALATLVPGTAHPLAAAAARLASVVLTPLAAACCLAIVRGALAQPTHVAAGRAKRLLAASSVALVSAAVVWELLGRPALSVADVGHGAFYPIVLAGVLAFPSFPTETGARRRFWLDTAAVVLSGAAAVWYVVLWPVAASSHAPPLDVLVNAAYPVADLVLLFAACVALHRRGRADGASGAALAWLAASLLVLFAADLAFVWYTASERYVAGGITDLLWMASSWCMTMAVVTPTEGARARAAEARRFAGGLGLLPYACVLVLHAAVLASVRDRVDGRAQGLLAATALVTAIVLARQWLASRELVRLREERAAAEAAARSEARFRSLVQHSSDVIAVVDAGGVLREVGGSVTRVLGYEADALLGVPLVSLVHRDDAAMLATGLAEAARSPDGYGPVMLRVRHRSGEWRTIEALTTNLLRDAIVGGLVVNARDVTERATLQAQLAHQAFHDPLTGLANRALFRDRVAHALRREGRDPEGVTVLFLDLDDFKRVNDSLGHAAGDALLVVVAERLRNATRGCDTVARLGGDEFAVLLEQTRGEEDALVVADRIVHALHVPITVEGTEVQVGASVGLARARPDDGPDELLRNADVAMYRAKQEGKGRHRVFAPEMHAAVMDRLALEGDLRRALAEPDAGQFSLRFQPIVRLDDAALVGVEALVRWEHPSRGMVPPAAFIPVAEATGLIVPLGRWVLREACCAGAAWLAVRGDAPPLSVTVNLSGRQLLDPGLLDDVADALDASALPPAHLVLEITETVIMQETEAVIAVLGSLKDLGVRLAIDDFGTGYSSLAYLQRFPIDILKIDKSFVDGVARGGSEAALARAIIALGDTLALRCIAEGVEEDAQRTHLRALGCGYAQGYLFSRPLPRGEVDALVAATTATAAHLGGPAAHAAHAAGLAATATATA